LNTIDITSSDNISSSTALLQKRSPKKNIRDILLDTISTTSLSNVLLSYILISMYESTISSQ